MQILKYTVMAFFIHLYYIQFRQIYLGVYVACFLITAYYGSNIEI